MPTYTKNLKLQKPLQEEFYDIEVINANSEKIDTVIGNKVDKIDGKGLSTNDYTNEEKEKLANLQSYNDSGLRQELSEKTGINAKATYANNTVTITAPISTQQITFIAPSDFSESDTYTINGTQVTITDLNNEPLSNAWKQGSPVQITIKGNQGFFKSGGGDSKLNIFAQPTQPPINEGIWLQTNDKFKNVKVANNVVQFGDWSLGNKYESAPIAWYGFDSSKVNDKVYFFGGVGTKLSDVVSSVYVYDLVANSWSKESSEIPTKRKNLKCASSGTKVYCIGGYATSAYYDVLEIYDTLSKTWSTGSPMPDKRFSFGCIVYGDKIYCLGGGSNSGNYFDTCYIYDISKNHWSIGKPMPVGGEDFGIAINGDEIYCAFGRGKQGLNSNIVVYKISKDEWSTFAITGETKESLRCEIANDELFCIGGRGLNGLDEAARMLMFPLNVRTYRSSTMPTRRYSFSSEIYDNKIYCFSGTTGQFNLSSIEVFDVESNKWDLNADLRKSRDSFGAVEHNGKIYSIAGSPLVSGSLFNDVEIYDIVNNKWSCGADAPRARKDFGCAINGDKIYCVGGIFQADNNYYVDVYDTKNNTWELAQFSPNAVMNPGCVSVGTKVYYVGGCMWGSDLTGATGVLCIYDTESKKWSIGANMPTPRYNFGCSVVGDKIYCMGGMNRDGDIDNKVEIYDIKTNTWSSGAEIRRNYSCGCVSVGDKIYCFGGSRLTEVQIYDTKNDSIMIGEEMLFSKESFCAIYYDFKIYALGGRTTSRTQIMRMVPTKFPENTLVLQNSVKGENKFYTQLINSKQLFGDRLLTGFENAWIYANEKLKEYPAYYGDGQKWNKFKN